MKINTLSKLALGIAGLSLLSAVGCSSSNSAADPNQPDPANAQIVHVDASNFKFTLDKTQFQAGTPIEFLVTDKEGVHGFSIEGASVSKTLQTGKTDKIFFTPTKAGTYTIQCSVFCGSGHSSMKTTFEVQ